MSLTLVFSDDLSHSSSFIEMKWGKTWRHGGGLGGAEGVVTIALGGRGWITATSAEYEGPVPPGEDRGPGIPWERWDHILEVE